MKRKLVAFTTSLMLLLSILVVGNVGAHPVTVVDTATSLPDRSRNEWFGTIYGEPSDGGLGMIERNSTNQGEFVFNDYLKDHRVVTGTSELTKSTDLDWFAITGDAENIYFLAKVDAIKAITANPVPELMVSIDTGSIGANNRALPASVGISVTAAAAWEYVVQTDFTTQINTGNVRAPRLWTVPTGSSGSCTGCQAQLVGGSNGGLPGSFIEIKVPWVRIGGKPTPDKALRFTASVYRKDHQHPADGYSSALIDVASRTKLTTDVLAQGEIKTYFDLHFDANGDVFSPLLISEFMPNPSGSEPPGPAGQGTEWIEIYNASTFQVQLSDYKIGDTTTFGSSSEAILKFPSKLLNPGDLVIVTQRKDIEPIKSVTPSAKLTIYDYGQLSAYTTPSGSDPGLNNLRDQIVLFDGGDTVADLVEYTYQGATQSPYTNSVPITFPPSGTPEGNLYSYERCPPVYDTNNADVDFLSHDGFAGGLPTPGVPCPPATGVDLRIAKTASPPSALVGANVTFFINWSTNGDGAFSSVVVSDTLPAGLTFVSQTANPPAAFVPSPGAGQPMQWTFANQTTNVSGTITLVAVVENSAQANIPLVNTAGVQSGDPNRAENADLLFDNFASASVTAIKPDLAVVSTWPGGVAPSASFTYVITATNHGVGDAADVVVSDTLPADISFVSAGSTTPMTQTGQMLMWQFDSLAAGASQAINVHVQLAPSVGVNQQRTNTIEISGTPPDDPTATADNTEEKTLVVGVIPDLSISTSGFPTAALPGAQFCYTINYRYDPAGAPTSNNVVIKDVLPQYLTLVSQTPSSSLTFNNATSGELSWTRASMNAGDAGTIGLCVKVNLSAVTGLKVNNVVTISGPFDSVLTGNNVDTKELTYDKSKVFLAIVQK